MTVTIYGPLSKVIIFVEGKFEEVVLDVIEFEQQLWAVPRWLEDPETGACSPERIILLDLLPDQKSGGVEEFFLLDPVPRVVLDGQIPSELAGRYTVIDLPDVILVSREEPQALQ